MTFPELLAFVFGVCVGFAVGYWAQLGLWSFVVAFISGIVFAVAFICVRIMILKR